VKLYSLNYQLNKEYKSCTFWRVARCTRYHFKCKRLSVACSKYSGFLHKLNRPPWYT